MQSHLPPVHNPNAHDALVRRGEAVLRGVLDTPGVRVESTPDIPGRWRIAPCCSTIYLRNGQTYEQLLDALDDALTVYRSTAGIRPDAIPDVLTGCHDRLGNA